MDFDPDAYFYGMTLRYHIAFLFFASILLFAACDEAPDSPPPSTPIIVSAPDSAGVDDNVQLVVSIPHRGQENERFTLLIDWGDGRQPTEYIRVEALWQFIATYSYFDPGDFDIRCRAVDGKGRVSAWSDPSRIRIGGIPLTGRGDWWMYMRDARHSGHSLLAGPSVPSVLFKQQYLSPIRTSAAFDRSGSMHFGYDGFRLLVLYADHREKWSYSTGGAQVQSSPLLLDDGTSLFGSNSANVYAVNRYGIKIWNRSVNGPIGLSSPAPLPDGGFVVGCTDGRVYAFAGDGTPKWMVITNARVSASPAVDDDGTTYIGSEDQILYAITPTGAVRWTYSTDAPIIGSASIAADGSIVFGNDNGWLHALRKDGRLKWRRDMRHPIRTTPATTREGRIVCALMNGDLVSLQLDGSEDWRTSFGLAAAHSSPVIDVHGTAYIGGADGALSAIDQTGKLRWRYETDAPITSTPSIGQRGQLVFGNEKGWLFVLGE
ncbi:MAG: PQQ-binding-like beta-propeller repeat protein [Bacteroidia bacterium]|nr:PQQ-binding-like beta-propeller repeat protein [Bacteroidia bacterium]